MTMLSETGPGTQSPTPGDAPGAPGPSDAVPPAGAAAGSSENSGTAAVEDKPPADQVDWRQRLAGDDADLLKQLGRFADETALAQSWLHAQKTISSSKKIDLPQAEWSEAQWGAFYEKLGRPKDPSGYKVQLNLPEGLELPQETQAVLTNVTQAGHKLGLSARQMQGVHEFVANLAVEQLQQSEQAILEQRAASERALRQLWGQEYVQNLRYAEAAVNQLHRETGVDWRGLANLVTMDGAKLGDRVEFVRLMAAAGRALGADPLLDVRTEGVAQSVEDRKKALMDLRISDPRKYGSSEVQAEINQLNAALLRR